MRLRHQLVAARRQFVRHEHGNESCSRADDAVAEHLRPQQLQRAQEVGAAIDQTKRPDRRLQRLQAGVRRQTDGLLRRVGVADDGPARTVLPDGEVTGGRASDVENRLPVAATRLGRSVDKSRYLHVAAVAR